MVILATVSTVYQEKRATKTLITKEAVSHFNKDQAFRFWATAHGGVYVPADIRTPPNANLDHIPERDIISVSGKKLTLMNPAYMLRQMMDEYSEFYGVRGRITSFKPLWPPNAPDDWEKKALKKLEEGADQVFEFVDMDGAPYLRLMSPMVTKAGCLKCHAHQGYKIGDIRGGVGVSVPAGPYFKEELTAIKKIILTNSIFWIMGSCLIWLGFWGLKRQYSRQKQIETALMESEKTYRLAMEAVSDGIWDWNIETNAVYYSRAWATILSEESIAPEYDSWASRIHPDDEAEVLSSLTRHLEGKSNQWAKEHRLLTRSGDWKWVLGRGRVVDKDGDGAPRRMVGTMADITEQLQLAEQLRQAQKMESVGRLAGGVAHDFNNMLSIILGNAEILMETLGSNHQATSNVDEIKRAAEKSATLTRQLLAFARKQTISPKVIDMNTTIEGMLKMLRRLIGEDIELTWRPGKNLEPVKIDPSQIDQMLANLCVNARDAIDDVGKVTIETHNVHFDHDYCRLHPEFKPGDYVLIGISDTGCGMNKETLESLFEPFFTTKKVGEGTGLGLATVYGIIKQNDGFINVYSEPDQGTTFKLYLPRHGQSPIEAPEMGKETLQKGSETILLVEDEVSILHMVKSRLERLGYRVLAADTPDEAMRISHMPNLKMDLLMTDVVMPSMNGRELAENISQSFPQIKILFMSGYTADVIAHRGILDEGLNFISKPFSIQDLSAKIREILDEKAEIS